MLKFLRPVTYRIKAPQVVYLSTIVSPSDNKLINIGGTSYETDNWTNVSGD